MPCVRENNKRDTNRACLPWGERPCSVKGMQKKVWGLRGDSLLVGHKNPPLTQKPRARVARNNGGIYGAEIWTKSRQEHKTSDNNYKHMGAQPIERRAHQRLLSTAHKNSIMEEVGKDSRVLMTARSKGGLRH